MKAKEILKDHKLSITSSRSEILEILLSKKVALSEKEIKNEISIHCDRATIYRTLNTFEKVGIVHAISSNDGLQKYVIKKEPENHVHFKCNICGHIICLPETIINNIELPEGYVSSEHNFLVIGTCKDCN